MRRLRNCTVALLLGCCAPLLIWVGGGYALYQRKKQSNLLRQAPSDAACAIDSDCPPGFVCVAGQCVPAE